MEIHFVQILGLVLLLAAIPAVTAGYFLDLRRARIAKQSNINVLSRLELFALAAAWILVAIFCWIIFARQELRISYAILAVGLIAFLMVSKARREKLHIKPGSRWYVGLVAAMSLSAIMASVVQSEILIWISGFLLAILMGYEIWSRILGIAK